MSSPASEFVLPRLYHRPGSADGSFASAGDLVAASPGLTAVHWDECRRLAPLTTPPAQSYPQGALGLFRGQSADFVLAHARVDAAGQPLVQYVLLHIEVVRQLAGRVTRLLALVGAEAPDLASAERPLPPYRLAPLAAPTEADQERELSALMLTLNDDFDVVEGLLAAVVQGRPLGIIRGPRALDAQLAFIQGLLTLLPVPARFGVTFSTFVQRPESAPVQVAFLAHDAPPEGYLCYDWEARALLAEPPEDPYSHFIVQQLRLDTSVAVAQLVALTRTTAWRLTRGEILTQALGWAAKRVALDAAVMEGQPADAETVAAVLREDPTLPDDLRVRYVRHLLAFTLVLQDPKPADPIGFLAQAHASVSDEALKVLDEAITEGKALLAYRLLARWIADPSGPKGWGWRRRAYTAASAHLKTLAAEPDMPGLIAFLGEVQEADAAMMMSEAAPELVEVALPLAQESPDLARAVFLLAANYLQAAPFQRLLRTKDFAAQLPQGLRDALAHFQPGQPTPAPPGMLTRVAAAFGERWELLVLARLVEWVMALERPDLVDTDTLHRLVALAGSAWGERFKAMLGQVTQALSVPSLLNLLDPPGPRLLVEIMLRLSEYQQVALLLTRISDGLFAGDAQRDFAPWVGEVFEKTALDSQALLDAFDTFGERALIPVQRAMAYRGALLNRQFDPVLTPLVDRLTAILVSDARLVQMVGYKVALRALQHHAGREDASKAIPLGAAITDSLAGHGDGLKVLGQLWTLLNWNKEVRQAVLEMMRRYTRQAEPFHAQRIPARVGQKLGHKIQDLLQATVTMNIALGGHDLKVFAGELRIASALLADIASAYETKPLPTMKRLRSDLDALTGGLTEDERLALGENLLGVARRVYTLGSNRTRGRGRGSLEQKLLEGSEPPRAGVDALFWIGGHFAKGMTIPLNLERDTMHHVTGTRSVNILLDELTRTRALLDRLLQAFPPDEPPPLTVEAFKAEIVSLWDGLRLYDQRQILDGLAMDAQGLAMVIALMADKGDERALIDSSLGRDLETARREPKSALEVMRLFSGYFVRKFSL